MVGENEFRLCLVGGRRCFARSKPEHFSFWKCSGGLIIGKHCYSVAAMIEQRVLVVIPVYNHSATLAEIARRALAVHPHVLVIDDGSTDLPFAPLFSPGQEPVRLTPEAGHPLFALPLTCLRHPQNRGKGAAIMSASREAARLGMTHIITIDAVGQHDPEDLPLFLSAAAADPDALIVGLRGFETEHVPFSSRFGRAFSNFWFTVHTGKECGDTQSGFRLYPVRLLELVPCTQAHYAFETEILVRASWAGFTVSTVPVRVHYPPGQERKSHFHPLLDNLRISLLNTRLTIRAIIPLPHKKYRRDATGGITPLRPLYSLRLLLQDSATPARLALSAALGIFLGTLPLIGLHSILILLSAGALRLNKIMGLAVSQLCMPPLIPALCIETGHYLRAGRWLTEISLHTLGYEAPARLAEWLLGALLLAPLLALFMALLVYVLAEAVRKGLREQKVPGYGKAGEKGT
jgi:glycosyltransferase involved in cell wall biosynthesis/uncharacterized protein (DUF2062 family)